MKHLLHIDGARGEGGGQILRTSLSMSMVTGTPVRIENIRAGRAKPGLMRQHLACVRAAQEVSDAEVSGAKVGSTEIFFEPRGIRAGDYRFAVGTAGSTTLIFQTVLPALVLADAESTLTLAGGTHNMWAPSFDFLILAYLPLLRRMGIEVEAKLDRHGFYPQGGGQWSAVVKPASRIHGLEVPECGEVTGREAVITSANVPGHVAERELREISMRSGWPEASLKSRRVNAMGGGNIVSLRLHHEHCTEVIESVGK
ncbi:MAG: RNA 3'-phosphate cyclase, partial [Gammaproteobacteria bacterium]|nr:RNA 3'-phosphate cyclase [Gammaproteobacteria bacterium]